MAGVIDNVSETSAKQGHHISKYMLSGILVLLPLGITVLVFKFLFSFTAKLFLPVVSKYLDELPALLRLTVSALIFLMVVYLVGLIVAHVVGRKIVAFGENLIMRLPVLKTIYLSSKRVVNAVAASGNTTFKSVVLIDFPRVGAKSIGFVTGYIEDDHGRKCCKIFIPTAPNPTSGFLQIIPVEDVTSTNISIDEGIGMIVSGGFLGPDKIKDSGIVTPVPVLSSDQSGVSEAV